jgi:AcrR family transcriptional regulator
MTRRRTGRRPGNQDTRKAILAAARDVFAERGYDGASIRQIATTAGVDPALVHHYFGTKDQLFMETVRPPIDPAELIPKLAEGGIDGMAERMLRTLMSIWEHPVRGPAFEALLRGAFSNRASARLARDFLAVQILRRAMHHLGDVIEPGEVPLRATLVASQIIGLATIRYILKFEPLASAPRETVIAAVGPTIQRYLTGELPGPPSA